MNHKSVFWIAAVLTLLVSGIMMAIAWREQQLDAATFEKARQIVVGCGLGSQQVRVISPSRSSDATLGLTGFYLDPATNQVDARVVCAQRGLRNQGIEFQDEMLRSNFVRPPQIP